MLRHWIMFWNLDIYNLIFSRTKRAFEVKSKTFFLFSQKLSFSLKKNLQKFSGHNVKAFKLSETWYLENMHNSTDATAFMLPETWTSNLCHQNTDAKNNLPRLLLMLLILLIQWNINQKVLIVSNQTISKVEIETRIHK